MREEKRLQKIGIKRNFNVLFVIIIALIFTCTVNIYAETPAPTAGPEATPTPASNVIFSIGDIKLQAQYSDNRIVDENLSICAEKKDINTLPAHIIKSVRAQEGDKDIFLYFNLSLLMNGREYPVNSQLDIYMEQTGILAEYSNLLLFKVTESGVSSVTVEEKEGKIIFSDNSLGLFLFVGIRNHDAPIETNDPSQSSPTLQEGETAGIISPGATAGANGNNARGITPGAFVFWIIISLVVGLWIGIGIGFVLWGRYKTRKKQKGPYVIGE